MQYNLKINDTDLVVDVESTADGYTFTIGDKTYDVKGHRHSPNTLWARINGRSKTLHVATKGGQGEVSLGGTPYKVEDNAQQRRRRRGGDSGGANHVRPPMPGSIVRVLVEDGAEVTKGQELLVMSAMKMETTLYAPADGVVTKVLVAEGDQVMADQDLVDFVPAAEESE